MKWMSILFILFFWPPRVTWAFSSLTRDWTPALGSESVESSPLDHQGIPWMSILSEIRTVLCLVTQSCLTLYNPVDYSPQGSSVHGIQQARILDWVAAPFSRGSSRPRDWTWVSCIAGRFFSIGATREAPLGSGRSGWSSQGSQGLIELLKAPFMIISESPCFFFFF